MLGLWEGLGVFWFSFGFFVLWVLFFLSALSENDRCVYDFLLVTWGHFHRLCSCGLTVLSSLICEGFCWLWIVRVFGVADIHSLEGTLSVNGLCELHFLQVCHQSCSWLIHELPTCKAALLSHNQHIHAQNYSQILVYCCSHPLFSSSVDFIQQIFPFASKVRMCCSWLVVLESEQGWAGALCCSFQLLSTVNDLLKSSQCMQKWKWCIFCLEKRHCCTHCRESMLHSMLGLSVHLMKFYFSLQSLLSWVSRFRIL